MSERMPYEMNPDYFETVIKAMRHVGIECARGLSASEIEEAEGKYGFRFPPDLRAFLGHVLPVGDGFPDWRSGNTKSIHDRLAWPADGVCFDVEHCAFWLPTWGPKPDSLDKAKARARQAIRAAPFMIPIFSHRFLPATPYESGNPVFSVYQTDIIYYSFDLPSYLFNEFGVPNPFPVPDDPREIEFWSEMERLD